MSYVRLPQPRSVTRNDLLRGLLSILPPGGIAREPGTNIYKLMGVIANSNDRVMQKLQELQTELNPGTSTLNGALREWEKAVLEEDCYDLESLTEAQRQRLVVDAIRGGIPNLTPTALKIRLEQSFPVIFAISETFPTRYTADLDYNFAYYSFPFVTITYSRTGLTDATVELIRCFIQTILPVDIVRKIVVET